MLDMVRGARALDKNIGKNIVVAGHSQGGHATLWAGSLAQEVDAGPQAARGRSRSRRPAHLGEQSTRCCRGADGAGALSRGWRR